MTFAQHTEDHSYWISISDLMAALLFIFILALSLYMIQFRRKTSEITQTREMRSEILRTLKEELRKHGIEVQILERHGVLRLSEGILFDSGKADIKERGMYVVNKLGNIMYYVLTNKDKNYLRVVDTIFIEGHTDNIPIVSIKEFKDNWDLSAKRAINTWKSLVRANQELGKLKNAEEKHLFSVSGYSDNRPVKPHNKYSGTPENRRIDFRFAMTPPKEEAPIIKELKRELIKSSSR